MSTQAASPLLILLASPVSFAVLLSVAVLLAWQGFAPASGSGEVQRRLSTYVDAIDPVVEAEVARPFTARVLAPQFRRLLRAFARLAPRRNAESLRLMLLRAGEPGHLSPLDFSGLRLLGLSLGGSLGLLVFGRDAAMNRAIIYGMVGAGAGYYLPLFWLRQRAHSRQHRITRALPDALDMLTIAVEAGLAFESAMMRVGDKWNNPLTHELRRAVAEIRVGTPREVALARMAERCGAVELSTFVAVLVQSTQLGVSIAQILHSQAAEMRLKRRQRAEELARQAGVKMVFPLVFCIFPALFVVILGPVAPDIVQTLNEMAASQAMH
jgi:tight adherence protein C